MKLTAGGGGDYVYIYIHIQYNISRLWLMEIFKN